MGANGIALNTVLDPELVSSAVQCSAGAILSYAGVMCQQNQGEVRQRVLDMRRSMRDQDNYILSTGCDIPPETPLENISAFMEAGKAPL